MKRLGVVVLLAFAFAASACASDNKRVLGGKLLNDINYRSAAKDGAVGAGIGGVLGYAVGAAARLAGVPVNPGKAAQAGAMLGGAIGAGYGAAQKPEAATPPPAELSKQRIDPAPKAESSAPSWGATSSPAGVEVINKTGRPLLLHRGDYWEVIAPEKSVQFSGKSPVRAKIGPRGRVVVKQARSDVVIFAAEDFAEKTSPKKGGR